MWIKANHDCKLNNFFVANSAPHMLKSLSLQSRLKSPARLEAITCIPTFFYVSTLRWHYTYQSNGTVRWLSRNGEQTTGWWIITYLSLSENLTDEYPQHLYCAICIIPQRILLKCTYRILAPSVARHAELVRAVR